MKLLPSGFATKPFSTSRPSSSTACAPSGTWQLPPSTRLTWRSARTQAAVSAWLSAASMAATSGLAQRLHGQMRVARTQLRFTAQAGGADHAAGRQIGQAFIAIGNEGVARVLAL